MGSSSKVILVGATSLIVGVYAISLKKAESSGVEAAMKHVKRVQNERIEDAALRTALDEFVADAGTKDKAGSRKGLGGGNFTYDVKKGASPKLTVTVTRDDGEVVTLTARLKKVAPGESVEQGPRKIHRGEWEVTKIFTLREKPSKKKS